ncbi:MAG: hypothetical protein PHF84_01315 [bacterium]|nr:hypothetical protein [bacterium]
MDKELSKQIVFMFEGFNRRGAHSFPAPGTLARKLSEAVRPELKAEYIVRASSEIVNWFASAAVEMWLRSLHSFLISASLTEASRIWASVSGYYSSHYSIRGFAHLFGIFQLYKEKRVIYLEKDRNYFNLRIVKKDGDKQEHKFYWKYVSEHILIKGDPFFYPNYEHLPESDCAHRNKVNYWDHVNHFPIFAPLDLEALKNRIDQIASIEFSSVPKMNEDKFFDIESIQILAYHRIVKFRKFLDDILGSGNRFWNVHRNPSWCPDTMKFNVVDPVYVALYARYS